MNEYIVKYVDAFGDIANAYFININDARTFCLGVENFSVWAIYKSGVNYGGLATVDSFDCFGTTYYKVDEMTTFRPIREGFYRVAKEGVKL